MSKWNPEQYLRFADERTRPCRDLVARIAVDAPQSVIDLGCGPGNSTAVLAERWPQTQLTGIDSSPDMIESAGKGGLRANWFVADIAGWATTTSVTYDVVFSNAALQWVSDHASTFPGLMRRVSEGGVLAVQMPANIHGVAHQLMRDVAASDAWRARFPAGSIREWHAHGPSVYYDLLAPHSSRLDLWVTTYQHVLPNAEAIVEWYRGTGLRPFLSALGNDADREAFASDYLSEIRRAFPPQRDGRVLFPFERLFLVATR